MNSASLLNTNVVQPRTLPNKPADGSITWHNAKSSKAIDPKGKQLQAKPKLIKANESALIYNISVSGMSQNLNTPPQLSLSSSKSSK